MLPNNLDTPNNSHHQTLKSAINQNLEINKRQLILELGTTEFLSFEGNHTIETAIIKDNRIVEIGIIELIDRQVSGNVFHVYLNPELSVDGSEFSLRLSDEFLSSKPLFVDIANELESFVSGAEIITNGASFLMRFLDKEWQLAGHVARFGTTQTVDILAIAKSKFPKQKNSLEELANRFNVKHCNRDLPSTLLEAEFIAKVYLHLTNDDISERAEIEQDPIYKDVMKYVITTQIADTYAIHRKFSLGYGRALAMIDALENNNIVSPPGILGMRYVLNKSRP